VDVDLVVVEQLLRAPSDPCAQMTVLCGIGLAYETVGELVADEWLAHVVEVGHEHPGRRDSKGDRVTVVVDELDDAHVGVEHQDAVAGCAAADQPFGRPERIDDGDGERVADGGPGLG
jgi:hypothetical protein